MLSIIWFFIPTEIEINSRPTINFINLKQGDLFTVTAAPNSVFERNGDRSYKDGVFEYLESKQITPESTLIFGRFLKYQYDNESNQLKLLPYTFIRENYVVSFLSDEWELFEHNKQN